MAAKLSVVTPESNIGHNSEDGLLDESKFSYLVGIIAKAQSDRELTKAADKVALDKVKRARKTAQSHGISLQELDLALELMDMDNPDEARGSVSRLIKYLRFGGFELPEMKVDADPYNNPISTTREELIWKERGKIAALTGRGAHPNEYPEHCPMDQYQNWAEGVMEGQKIIASRMAVAGPLFDTASGGGAAEPDSDLDDGDDDAEQDQEDTDEDGE